MIHSMFLAHAVVAAALCTSAGAGLAQNRSYPDKPIRLVLPIAAGGGLDIVVRPLTQRLSESLKQAVVVDNRPGGGGTIGSATIVRAEADGYTVGAVSGSFATNAAIYKLPFDPLARPSRGQVFYYRTITEDLTPLSFVNKYQRAS